VAVSGFVHAVSISILKTLFHSTYRHRFEEASDRLRDLSLIRINDETIFLRIHRLIQEAFFDRMEYEHRIDAFKIALKLLRDAFPGRSGHTHLYTRWQVCKQLRQHVLAFQSRYEQLKEQGFSSQEESFIRLICDYSWSVMISDFDFLTVHTYRYLLEIQSFQDCEKTLRTAEANCEDKNSIAYAYLCCNFVSLYERTGRSRKSVQYAFQSLKIREPISMDKDPNDLPNAYSDVGYLSVSNYKAKDAIEYLGRRLILRERTQVQNSTRRSASADSFAAAVALGYYLGILIKLSRTLTKRKAIKRRYMDQIVTMTEST